MLNPATTAFVFPGQGSQVVGMGKDLADAFPAARSTFEQADDVLGFSLSRLLFEGPESDLNDTLNTQPALYVCGIATLRALQAELPQLQAAYMAGHSLGEFTALAAAGAFSFEDGLRLVRERGRLMKAAGEEKPGAMAALLGLDAEVVRDICERASSETGRLVVLANDNCPGQIVISGESEALDRAVELAKEAGARRAVRLAVSIASHSPLMQSAAEAFAGVLESTPITAPQAVVIANTSVTPLETEDAIRQELRVQLVQSVRWTETVRALAARGVTTFLEFGPKDVLTGLLRRIDNSADGVALNSAEAVRQFAAANT
ncbi:MAG: ACP S-malonyltransferase [Chloroflexota bacterium]|nr:MAG: [acyl-carrier-protein] S-malonyltransferase [Chloroflexota bacterium]